MSGHYPIDASAPTLLPPPRSATGWQADGSYVPCPECKWRPPTWDGPGTPVRLAGTIHNGWCPTIPRLSPEAERELRARLKEFDDCRRRAWAHARNYVIG